MASLSKTTPHTFSVQRKSLPSCPIIIPSPLSHPPCSCCEHLSRNPEHSCHPHLPVTQPQPSPGLPAVILGGSIDSQRGRHAECHLHPAEPSFCCLALHDIGAPRIQDAVYTPPSYLATMVMIRERLANSRLWHIVSKARKVS